MTPLCSLPQQLTSFIGRERETAEVERLLSTSRLLTLTGAGGSGKTRLALRAASRAADTLTDGACWVELAPLADGELVPHAVAAALEVREEPGRALSATLAEHLMPLEALLVLDNCEHLVSACARLVTELLGACPRLRVLATSRQPLGLAYEVTLQVPAMSLPDARDAVSPESLTRHEAVELFVERARLKRPDFTLTAANAPALVRLVRGLDGIPLAIELAAARVRVLSVEQIADRLDERFRLLASTGHAPQARHRTLKDMLDWSYDLLSEGEQALFRSLSVFAGSFTLRAVEEICAEGTDEYEVLELIGQLVDKSLLQADEQGAQTCYRLLETVRQYAAEKLEEQGGAGALRDRHLAWYLQLAESSEDELLSGRQGEWLERMEREHDNLRAALGWSLESIEGGGRSPEAALRIAGALAWFWYFRGRLEEGRGWLRRVLAAANPESRTAANAKALSAAGVLAFLQSDLGPAREYLERGLAIWRELGDTRGTAFSLTFLGRVAARQGDPDAPAIGEESVSLFRQIDERWGLALALDFLGEVARQTGDDTRAEALHDESLALYRDMSHSWGIALELSNFGRMALSQGDYAEARRRMEEALAMQREVGDKWAIAWTLRNLGEVAQEERDYARAKAHYTESLDLFGELGDRGGAAGAMQLLGNLARLAGDSAEAVQMLRRSLGMFEELRDRRNAAAVEVALRLVESVAAQAPAHAGDDANGLTMREVGVLCRVAEGLTDAQIAEQLSLSTRTVQAHIRSIYSKLNITSRSAATRYAIEHGLDCSGC